MKRETTSKLQSLIPHEAWEFLILLKVLFSIVCPLLRVKGNKMPANHLSNFCGGEPTVETMDFDYGLQRLMQSW